MPSGFNWARSRMQTIIAQRGSEPASHGLPSDKSRYRKRKRSRTLMPSPVHQLLREFESLKPEARAARAAEFRSRLRAVATSDDEAQKEWQRLFVRKLRGLREGETLAEAATGMREAARRYRARRPANTDAGHKDNPAARRGTASRTASRKKRPRTDVRAVAPIEVRAEPFRDGIAVAWASAARAEHARIRVTNFSGERVAQTRCGAHVPVVHLGKLRDARQPLTVEVSLYDARGPHVATGSASIALDAPPEA